jgi:hypothetical protein
MSNYYAILIGAQNMRDIDCVEFFEKKADAVEFSNDRNVDFMAEYDSKDAWLSDSNSLEWVVFDEAEAEKEHPNLVSAGK